MNLYSLRYLGYVYGCCKHAFSKKYYINHSITRVSLFFVLRVVNEYLCITQPPPPVWVVSYQ